jgi:hypothetical protein
MCVYFFSLFLFLSSFLFFKKTLLLLLLFFKSNVKSKNKVQVKLFGGWWSTIHLFRYSQNSCYVTSPVVVYHKDFFVNVDEIALCCYSGLTL